jgi:hypothetical protein
MVYIHELRIPMRFIVLVLLTASPAALAIPTQMGHQGRVLDADGLPADGPHTLDFHLYDAAEDGTMVWSEVHDVELINGYYSLVLGADELDNPLDDSLLRDNELHLELTVDDDVPLSPRQALNAVPYARIATSATNVSGGTVDASEIRVGGSVVVDSSGGWVGATPSVSWSDLSDVPEDVDTVLSEDEVDAFCSDNGYALSTDLASVATSGSWSDLSGVPDDVDTVLSEDDVDAFCADNGYALSTDLAAVATSGSWDDLADVPEAAGLTGVHAEHFTESGSFVVPDGITSLIVYVTGGGGGGSNGAATALELGGHSHGVGEHSHEGGTHTHGIGDHAHQDGTECVTTSGSSYSGYYCSAYGPHMTSASSGSTGTVDDGSTGPTGLTTNEASGGSGSINTAGGDGGSGGGISAIFAVLGDTVCEVVIGSGGDPHPGGAGSSTTVTCDDQSVECGGGAAGNANGVNGDDGLCTVSGGTRLNEYKASRLAPGGGGSGGNGSGAATGQVGTITIRY